MLRALLPTRPGPRWLAIAAGAAALLPVAAHASVGAPGARALNAKPSWFAGKACRNTAGLGAPALSLNIAPAIADEAPSALERARLSQQRDAADADVASTSAAAAATVRPIAPRAASLFEPGGSVSTARAPYALAAAPADCAVLPGLDDRGAVTAAPDPDSELGTVAIPVEHTPFDQRWDRVRRAPSAKVMQAQLQRAGVTRGLGETEMLQRVNQWVNDRIAYVNDERNYRLGDVWATAEETIIRGSGDCEDFAILKMQLLRAAGIDGDRLKLVLLRDLAANADHAFLLVRSRDGNVVLDNMTDRLYDGSQPIAVRPILSFSGNRRWLHGYRDVQPPQLVEAAPAAQKSRAAAIANARPVGFAGASSKTGAVVLAGNILHAPRLAMLLPNMMGRQSPEVR